MQNPKHPNHEQACSNGGKTQTSKEHHCPLCNIIGTGPRFEQYHLTDLQCNGQGFKNKKSKKKWLLSQK